MSCPDTAHVTDEQMVAARQSLIKYGQWVAGDDAELQKQGVRAQAMTAAVAEQEALCDPQSARVVFTEVGVRIEPGEMRGDFVSEEPTDA